MEEIRITLDGSNEEAVKRAREMLFKWGVTEEDLLSDDD